MTPNTRFLSYRAHFFLKREMFQTKVVEKIKNQILCPVNILFLENRALCEIMWKNFVERVRPQIKIWLMCIECWMPKAKNAHSHNM